MLKAIVTGNTPLMTAKEKLEVRRQFRELGRRYGREAQEREVERMDRAYDARKASAADNAQKNATVLTNVAVTIAVIATIIATRSVLVMAVGALGLLVMAGAVVLAQISFAPKWKNWTTNNVGNRALDDLGTILGPDPLDGDDKEQTAIAALPDGAYNGVDPQLEHHYLDSATGFHHWDQLLLLERREFGAVCLKGIAGMVIAVVAVMTVIVEVYL